MSWLRRNRNLVERVRELGAMEYGTNPQIAAQVRMEFKTPCSPRTVQRILNEKKLQNPDSFQTVPGQFGDPV